ncbi:hypothetical protein Sa4125_33490 [Aureimonas sp. SA4125]|nr:hypothetical protein Sa4125_33490 [Aureimonas sp. SA4125]
MTQPPVRDEGAQRLAWLRIDDMEIVGGQAEIHPAAQHRAAHVAATDQQQPARARVEGAHALPAVSNRLQASASSASFEAQTTNWKA